MHRFPPPPPLTVTTPPSISNPPPPHQRHGQQPVSGTADPGVVKQDKSSRGSVDTTKIRSGPQRVRTSSGERPIGAAKGKQSDNEALCQPPPPIPGELLQWQAMLPNGFNTLRQFYHTARGPRVIQPGTQKSHTCSYLKPAVPEWNANQAHVAGIVHTRLGNFTVLLLPANILQLIWTDA